MLVNNNLDAEWSVVENYNMDAERSVVCGGALKFSEYTKY